MKFMDWPFSVFARLLSGLRGVLNQRGALSGCKRAPLALWKVA
jgi:hypothetical protein